MRIFTFLLLSVLFAPNFGQNLVLNPSLEEFTKEGYPAFWTKINLTPDIYAANRELSDEGGKKHAYKDVFASRKFGTTCFGLLFSHFFTEVIQAKLASPLEEGKTYKVSLHVICPRNYIGKPIWEVSVHFSQKSLPRLGASTYSIPFTSLHQTDYQYLDNKEEWVEVTGYYKAEGGEKFISIGNFTGANKEVLNEQTQQVIYTENFPVQMRGMYMYIFDNLEVKQENVPDYLAEYRQASAYIPQQAPDSPPKTAPKTTPAPTIKATTASKTPAKGKDTPPAPDPLAPYLSNVVVSNIRTLYFDKGQHQLWETSFHALDSVADVMKKYPYLVLQLSGHTSDEGDAKMLTDISQKRANAARDYLVSAGISSKRLVCKALGSSQNVTKNESYETRLKNQRVELAFLGEKQDNIPDYWGEYQQKKTNPTSANVEIPAPIVATPASNSITKPPVSPVSKGLEKPTAPEVLAPYLSNVVVSNIHTLYFDKGEHKLWETSFHALDSLADIMKQYPHLMLELSGHTSDEGTPKALTELSQKRANAAKDYLISAGIPARRLICKALGSSHNIGKNESYESRLKNQRVEMEFIDGN